jgi:hypothetical protein
MLFNGKVKTRLLRESCLGEPKYFDRTRLNTMGSLSAPKFCFPRRHDRSRLIVTLFLTQSQPTVAGSDSRELSCEHERTTRRSSTSSCRPSYSSTPQRCPARDCCTTPQQSLVGLVAGLRTIALPSDQVLDTKACSRSTTPKVTAQPKQVALPGFVWQSTPPSLPNR